MYIPSYLYYLSGSKPRMHSFEAVWWNSRSRFKHCAMHAPIRSPKLNPMGPPAYGPQMMNSFNCRLGTASFQHCGFFGGSSRASSGHSLPTTARISSEMWSMRLDIEHEFVQAL